MEIRVSALCTLCRYRHKIHSTGAARRLNRFADIEGDRFEQYSFEELVAEFGAASLCGFAGIENRRTEALQASYIEGWARVFQQDSRVLVRAASAAQRAADYIRGKVPAQSTTIATNEEQPLEVTHAIL